MRVTPFDWMLNMLPNDSEPPKKPLATWVSTWWFKGLVALSVAFAGYLYGNWMHDNGVREGLKGFHQMCYNNSDGMMSLDKETGHVIMCAPLTTIPKEEIKNINPKGLTNT